MSQQVRDGFIHILNPNVLCEEHEWQYYNSRQKYPILIPMPYLEEVIAMSYLVRTCKHSFNFFTPAVIIFYVSQNSLKQFIFQNYDVFVCLFE